MGAKYQYALNPLSTASSNNSLAENRVPNWGLTQEFSIQDRTVMHKSTKEAFHIKSLNKENIRKTILMHEDIFQLQVKQLHQLYDRQLKLMSDLKNQVALGTRDANLLVMWQKQMHDIRPKIKHDSSERSASCSGDNPRLPIGRIMSLERVSEEQQEPSPRVQTRMDEEIDIELSLSIGGGKRKNRKTLADNTNERKPCKSLELESSFGRMRKICSSGLMVRRETMKEDFGEPSPVMSSSSVTHDKTASNWLLQDLSKT